jgi:hypothetical protein
LIVLYLFQACGDAKSKPAFLSDKTLESSIKYIVRRFPNIDIKGVCSVLFWSLLHLNHVTAYWIISYNLSFSHWRRCVYCFILGCDTLAFYPVTSIVGQLATSVFCSEISGCGFFQSSYLPTNLYFCLFNSISHCGSY